MAVPPDREINWTPRQREVLDLLAEGKTNAEIAERLGVTFDGAKFHVSEILNRLGVTSREEAAAYWRANRPTAARRVMTAITGAALWKYAAAGLGVVLLGGLAVLLVVAANSDEDEPASTDPTETPTASETVTPSPTATPEPARDPEIEDAPGAFTVTTYPNGATVEHEAAAVFVNVETGEAEVVALATNVAAARYPALFLRSDRWVTTLGSEMAYLYDREADRAYTWPGLEFRLLDATDELLAFGPGQYQLGSGRVVVYDAEFNVVARGELPHDGSGDMTGASGFFSPAGDKLVFSIQPDGADADSPPTLGIMDIASGTTTVLAAAPPPPGDYAGVSAGFNPRHATADFFEVLYNYRPADPTTQRYGAMTQRFGWDGQAIGPAREDGSGDMSPNGRFGLVEDHFAYDDCQGPGQCTTWSAVQLIDLDTGEALFRVKGASTGTLGAGWGSWFADGQTFLTVVGGLPAEAGAERNWFGFVEVGLDGVIVRRLDYECDDLFCRAFPSPYSRDLMALGYSRVSGPNGVVGVAITQPPQLKMTPWGPDPGTVRVAVPPIGGEGANIPRLPNPVIDFPPFDNEIRLRASFLEGDCLNVREAAGVENASLACVPEGEVVVAVPGLVQTPPPQGALMLYTDYDEDFNAWIHVRTAEGAEGWVAQDYLDWSP